MLGRGLCTPALAYSNKLMYYPTPSLTPTPHPIPSPPSLIHLTPPHPTPSLTHTPHPTPPPPSLLHLTPSHPLPHSYTSPHPTPPPPSLIHLHPTPPLPHSYTSPPHTSTHPTIPPSLYCTLQGTVDSMVLSDGGKGENSDPESEAVNIFARIIIDKSLDPTPLTYISVDVYTNHTDYINLIVFIL